MAKQAELDPLYVIFEQHLYNFQDSDIDRKTFVTTVIQDYLSHLRKMNIIVPKSLENSIIEELSSQVNTMLVKKIYGFIKIGDYQKRLNHSAKRGARVRYQKLGVR